jgi:hypothetical protein
MNMILLQKNLREQITLLPVVLLVMIATVIAVVN